MGCATVAAVFVSTQQVARGKTHKGRGTLAVDIWRGPLTLHCPLPQSIAHSVILSCFFFFFPILVCLVVQLTAKGFLLSLTGSTGPLAHHRSEWVFFSIRLSGHWPRKMLG